jgi:hypothetical protein
MNKTLIRRKILTYALISVNFAGHGDPVVALSPLFAPIASDLAGQLFDPSQFRQAMSQLYGMSLTRDVVDLFSQRLRQLGWVLSVQRQLVSARAQ